MLCKKHPGIHPTKQVCNTGQKKMGKGIDEMVQWVEVLAANKPKDLSSIPGPHTVERENRFPEVVQFKKL